MTIVVIGVGNSYRRDDGAGPAVADRVRSAELPEVTVVEADGEPSRLIDSWDGAALAVLVDAVQSDAEAPGTVHRSEVRNGAGAVLPSATSTHGFDALDAWALGDVLGRCPDRLVTYGIVGACFDQGIGLSASVSRAVDEVALAVVNDVRRRAGAV